MYAPPSTTITCPVIYEAASLARKSVGPTMSNDKNSLFGVSRRELEIALSDPPAAPVSEPQAQQGE